MIEKPKIADENIVHTLNSSYSIEVNRVEFLPIGNDATAFSYRVEALDGNAYFLKIKMRLSNLAGLYVPRFLKDHGIKHVIAPMTTKKQNLIAEMDGFNLILYPFVSGKEAMQVGMQDSQWKEFGSVLQQIHDTKLPSDVSQSVEQETFIPKWSSLAKDLDQQVNRRNFDDPYQKKLAAFWKENNETIRTIVERAEMVGERLQQAHLEFVLCHADIHTANILLTPNHEMFIVDWDDTLFAPKERDLMHILEKDTIQTRDEQIFFDGYGEVKINQLALTYYRYEWCVQEIGDFGHRVFLTEDVGKATRREAVEGFITLFSPNDVIETALNTPFEIEIRNHP
jgi:spectinomycin phosphotransferase